MKCINCSFLVKIDADLAVKSLNGCFFMDHTVHCIIVSVVGSGQVPLSQLFQKSSDTWECPMCMITNQNTASVCAACSSSKPTTDKDVPTVSVDFVILSVLSTSIRIGCYGINPQIHNVELFSVFPVLQF